MLLLAAILIGRLFDSAGVTVSPVAEAAAQRQLMEVKQHSSLAPFESDGCSGNVSSGWARAIAVLSETSQSFGAAYASASTIPFEAACVTHDQAYHLGDGGYVGRWQADLQLRADIIEYGITHVADIKARTGIATDEQVYALYEVLAETVYRGVRLGGAPCTGMPYAWGYGYGGGVCSVD